MVGAPVFWAWWEHLRDLFARNPHDTTVATLLRRLAEAGRASGATHYQDDEGLLLDPLLTPIVRNPAFDWQEGTIAFGPVVANGRTIGARQLIAELALATGIAAQDAPALP